MNIHSPAIRSQIARLSLEGMSNRAICKLLSVSKNTVLRYAVNAALLCECGQEQGHRGWCESLVEKSIQRKMFLETWRKPTFTFKIRRRLLEIRKTEYIWSCIKALSYRRWVDLDEFEILVARLSNKHGTQNPEKIAKTTSSYWRYKPCIGMRNGRLIRSEWERGLVESGKSPIFCWIEQRQHCLICEKSAFVESTLSSGILCGSEWCERLHDYYYVQRKSRPLTVVGVKDKQLRFNFLLADYIKRSANE